MSHQRSGLPAQIEAGVLGEKVPLSSHPQKRIVLSEPGIHGWMVTAPRAQESAPVCDG